MSIYQKNFSNWRRFLSDEENNRWPEIISEVSPASANKILDFIANAAIDDLAFDDLFDGKMRITLPLTFDPKSLGPRDLIQFTGVMQAIKDQGWVVDGESFAKGVAYKEVQPPDFGTELNLKRYGKETPPPPKRKEMKIGRIISKNKSISDQQKKWYSDNAGKLVPQYTAIISRYPIDILRMSDFKAIQSCHSEGGEYFQCTLAEAKGHGPVSFTVRTNKLENFLEGKPIEYYDDQEIFEDKQRGIDGMIPVSRVRLRRFYDDVNDIDLAVPELRFYGNHIGDFLETVSKWALKNQFDKISDDIYVEDSDLFSDPEWWRKYDEGRQQAADRLNKIAEELRSHRELANSPTAMTREEFHTWQAVEKEYKDVEETYHKLTEELQEKVNRLSELMPDIDNFYLRGGTYKDSPASKMLASFFGLGKYRWEKDQHRLVDNTIEFGIPSEVRDLALRKFRSQRDLEHYAGDDEEERSEIEQRLEEYNDNFSELEQRLGRLQYIHASVSDLEHDLGYDMEQLAEEDRLFYYINGGIAFEFDEAEFTEKMEDLDDHGDWRDKSDLAQTLADELESEVDLYGTGDHSVEFYSGRFHFRYEFSNDDYHYGTDFNAAWDMVGDLLRVDDRYEELENFVRGELMELGYLRATPFHEFKGKVKEEDFQFENFELDIDHGTIFIGANHHLGPSPYPMAVIADPSLLKVEITPSEWEVLPASIKLGGHRPLDKTISPKIWTAINKDINNSIEYASRQLSLVGVEADKEDLMSPFTDVGKFEIQIWSKLAKGETHPRAKYNIHLSAKLSLVSNDEEEEVLASIKTLEYLDKNYDSFIHNITDVIADQIQEASQLVAQKNKKINESISRRKKPRKIRIKLKK